MEAGGRAARTSRMELEKTKEQLSRPAAGAVHVCCTAPGSKIAAVMDTHTINMMIQIWIYRARPTCRTTVTLPVSVRARTSRS